MCHWVERALTWFFSFCPCREFIKIRKKNTPCVVLEVGPPCSWTVCGRSTPSWHCWALLSGTQWSMSRWPRPVSSSLSKVWTWTSSSTLRYFNCLKVCLPIEWLMTSQLCNGVIIALVSTGVSFEYFFKFFFILPSKNVLSCVIPQSKAQINHALLICCSLLRPPGAVIITRCFPLSYIVQLKMQTMTERRHKLRILCISWSYLFWNNMHDYSFRQSNAASLSSVIIIIPKLQPQKETR